MKQFFVALAPDGGLGYRNDKDTVLGLLLFGDNKDYNLARSAIYMCMELLKEKFYLYDVFNHAWDFIHKLPDGSNSEPFINIKVTKNLLLSLVPSDVEAPEKVIEGEILTIRNYSNWLSNRKDIVVTGDPDPAAMFDFIDRFTLHLLEFFNEDPLKRDIPVMDMAIAKKDKNFSGLSDRLKMIKDV
jgi:hypothetical protein